MGCGNHNGQYRRAHTSCSSGLHCTSHCAELRAVLKLPNVITCQLDIWWKLLCGSPALGGFHQLEISTFLKRLWQHSAILYNFGKGLEMPWWEGAGPGWVDTREERRGVAGELQKMYNSPNLDRPTLTFISAKYDNV